MSSTAPLDVVLLTQGRRTESLNALLTALRTQTYLPARIIVVRNGGDPVTVPDGVELIDLPENLGIPAGRNVGFEQVTAELVMFLDDDVSIDEPGLIAALVQRFASQPRLGMIQPRVRPTAGGRAPGRWVPRLRDKDPARSSLITVVWEGAIAARTAVMRSAGAWPAPLFYTHEGIEIGWRIWDQGFAVEYRAEISVCHPALPEGRHPQRRWFSARNRVLMARRALPLPIGVIYVGVRGLLELTQCRRTGDVRQFLSGTWEGMRMSAQRDPIQWRTVWALARAGRPPVL